MTYYSDPVAGSLTKKEFEQYSKDSEWLLYLITEVFPWKMRICYILEQGIVVPAEVFKIDDWKLTINEDKMTLFGEYLSRDLIPIDFPYWKKDWSSWQTFSDKAISSYSEFILGTKDIWKLAPVNETLFSQAVWVCRKTNTVLSASDEVLLEQLMEVFSDGQTYSDHFI